MIEISKPHRVARPKRLGAAVLDWAGTTVDYGSRAPVAAMQAAFDHVGLEVSEEETRRPMGRAKRDHLSEILQYPQVMDRWKTRFGRESSEQDLDEIYTQFLTLQTETVAQYSGVIEGCTVAIEECRELGLRIGSSTGYTRQLLERVIQRAYEEGYSPDIALSADDISPGRPAPWLCTENARRLGVFPMAAVVKVDDTPAGVLAGRNAGAWSVGVVDTGNEVGLSKEALDALADDDRENRLQSARRRLEEAGAHFLISSIQELPTVVRRINELLSDEKLP